MLEVYITAFFLSLFLLYVSGKWIIGGLERTARFLGWREFVVAFFIMAFAASLNNLFVGIASAVNKIPQLSFGDVVGGNVIDLTLALALAILFSPKKEITAESRMVQSASVFTFIAAIFPLILVSDGRLSRIDGGLLIAFFLLYFFWTFSKRDRFGKVYDGPSLNPVKDFKLFLKDLVKIIAGVVLLLIAAEGIVNSAQFFASSFHLPLTLVGILIVGLGNALPETYFAVIAARKGSGWMILGNLMGAVITAALLVLGIVALIRPIEIADFSPFVIARTFMLISVVFFLFFIRNDRKLTEKEAVFLLSIYILFVLSEIFIR